METGILKTLEYQVIREILASYCSSPLGKALAARLKPARSFEKADKMVGETNEMKAFLESGGTLNLRGAYDVVNVVTRALEMNRAIDPEGLGRVSELLMCFSVVRSQLRTARDVLATLWEMVKGLDDLAALAADLDRTVDRRGKILSSASERLFELRRSLENLRYEVRSKAEAYLNRQAIARWLQDRQVRIRNDRFVLPVRAECRGMVKGVVHGFSASGNTVFVEPEELVERQNRLEELGARENREITRILLEKTRVVIDALVPLRKVQRALEWLDFTLARARYSVEYRLVPPVLSREPLLEVHDARHPILLKIAFDEALGDRDERIESARSAVVPLGLHLGKRFDVLVITGPNTGGKTVALKTAGLLSLMVASGLHVPAGAGSRFPLFSHVLADIGDEQDIFQSLSTFSSHIKRISQILRTADDQALVLLDELGSGTDPQEGEALGRSILAFLLQRGVKVLASTHLSKLKEFAFSNAGVENGCMEFDPDSLRPTFKLSIGTPGESNAIRIARRLGVPQSILVEAEKALASHHEGMRELMDGITRARMRVEAELDQSVKANREARSLREELSSTKAEIDRRSALLEEEAEREIDLALRRAHGRAMDHMRKLKNLPASQKVHIDRLAEALDEMLERTTLAEKRRLFVETLKKGDVVYIPRFREKCRVRKIRKKEAKLEVEHRNMTVDLPFGEVMWPHWF